MSAAEVREDAKRKAGQKEWMSAAEVREEAKLKKGEKYAFDPFIVRLGSAGGKWVVDMRGQGGSWKNNAVCCLKSVTFSRDCKGNQLEPPVQQLTACFDNYREGNAMMFRVDGPDGREGSQHRWPEAYYTPPRHYESGRSARAVVVHRDTVTGIERIFALAGPNGVASGAYDPESDLPGKVVWHKRLEDIDYSTVGDGKQEYLPIRPLSLVVANEKLFMSSGGCILQRIDGPSPVWKTVIDITNYRNDGELSPAVGGIRGMTALPGSASSPDSILFCWNPNGASKAWILRSDFAEDGSIKEPVEETSMREEAQKYLQTPYLHYTLAAYNDMPRVQVGPHICNLIGFETTVTPLVKHIRFNPNQMGCLPGKLFFLPGVFVGFGLFPRFLFWLP